MAHPDDSFTTPCRLSSARSFDDTRSIDSATCDALEQERCRAQSLELSTSPPSSSLSLPLSENQVTQTTFSYQMTRVWQKVIGSRTTLSWDQFLLVSTIMVWFIVGACAIVTTKMLATTWKVPPLLLTTQQMLMGSTILRTVLSASGQMQPWPVETASARNDHHFLEEGSNESPSTKSINNTDTVPLIVDDMVNGGIVATTPHTSTVPQKHVPSYDRDFLLTGLFNALDFLASNSAFYFSAASFVETIKASEPITTSMVALFWGIDQLRLREAVSLVVLISGVLLSTIDNAETHDSKMSEQEEEAQAILSIRTALTVMTANICFAFRALSQKKYRANTVLPQLNDVNLLYRMQQMGATALILPAILAHGNLVISSLYSPTNLQMQYISLTLVNTVCFATYNAASSYVLSHVTVLHHSGLNCVRRMFVTIAACLFFGVTPGIAGIVGIILCFVGFVSFTQSRAQRRGKRAESISEKPKESVV